MPSKIVLAAGALVWREHNGSIEVLLIHRPSYNDWSIPKGKLDKRESFPAAAVREVEEETGYAIRLHRPLPSTQYKVGRNTKFVAYWVGTVRARRRPGPVNRGEVDQVQWMSLDEALARATGEHDQELIRTFAKSVRKNQHRTAAVIVQRHASALPRSKSPSGEEASRPLTKKGRKQASALPNLISAFDPSSVISSPWQRCLDTVIPYAESAGQDVVVKTQLTEDNHSRRPSQVAALVARSLEQSEATLICTHRPVLPTVFTTLRNSAKKKVAASFPDGDPYLLSGEMLVAHVTSEGKVIATEKHMPDLG